MGLLVEKIEGGQAAGISDLEQCKNVLRRLDEIGLLHGDVNRYNIIIVSGEIKPIDFENSCETTNTKAFETEIGSLERKLQKNTRRGRGFRPEEEHEDEC